MKRSISLLLCLVMLLSLLAGCGGGGSAGDAQEITWWIGTGEDATYYASYDENPAVKYLETMQFNGQNIDLKFSVPVAGAELDNFNTLMATEEYTDLMDMSFSTSSASELFEDGIIWDLTPYVEQYMPNYWALINEYPEIKDLIYSNVNGEQKLLTINSISREILSNFMGFLYRRDWVAKYGKNPTTGEAFTYGFTGENGAWEDNVVFPMEPRIRYTSATGNGCLRSLKSRWMIWASPTVTASPATSRATTKMAVCLQASAAELPCGTRTPTAPQTLAVIPKPCAPTCCA